MNNCDQCGTCLQNTFVRKLKTPKVERVYVGKGQFLDHEAREELIGHCPMHGLVRQELFAIREQCS